MEELITVEEALNILSQNALDLGTEQVTLESAVGRILMEDIKADRDFPPYDRVTMDGIAIQFDKFNSGQRSFEIKGMAAAGAVQLTLEDASGCLEVMTGSIMPSGADTIIRYEDVTIHEGMAHVDAAVVKPQQNIHFKGSDRKSGDLIVPKQTKLGSAEMGACATVGKYYLTVASLPKTIIISTGDELVDIDQSPLPHQIRKSNVYSIKAALKRSSISAEDDHLEDDFDSIVAKLNHYVSTYDVIILSGGVSKGKFDFLPEALDKIGVVKKFHKIKQRPGKPFWFGVYQNKCAIFALPGNPVSSFLCVHKYFNHWLNQCQRMPAALDTITGILAQDVSFKPDLTYFLEVKIEFSDGEMLATPVKGNGSGDLANLVDADAFMELPRGRETFLKGEAYPIFFYR